MRHLKDGLPENQKSKASLILAVHKLCSILEAEYFPAYEIVTDELRDYRFYDGDMVHPNETAVSYIWKKFSDTYFDEETESICFELEAIISGLNHRPIHPESESHRRFLENLDRRIESFRQKYPFIPLPR